VRNLALRDGEKGLSTGEKQMYVKAKKILASELMYAKTMSEDEALEWLEETLTNGAKPKATPAERKAAATAARPAATVKKAAPVAKKAAPAKAKSVASRTVVKSSGVKSSAAKSAVSKSAKPAAKRKTTAAK
jgi:hypothetical protein